MSWFCYNNTHIQVNKGWLLIPKYAQSWAGVDKLKIAYATDYADFQIVKNPTMPDDKYKTCLNGHILIGIFETLYNGKTPPVSLTDCYFDKDRFPFENTTLEKLRRKGIYNDADSSLLPFSLKVVHHSNNKATYENAKGFSPCGQFNYFND